MASPYSREQISQFLDYISIPTEFRLDAKPGPDLALLRALHVHMITTVPYENLALHYSSEKRIHLDPQFLFQKIVGSKRGRGGYCLENSILFLHVLRALGFTVYPVGVKVRLRVNGVPTGGYLGWVHIVNVVTLPDNSRYVVDVAFGGDGMTQPIPLEEGTIIRNLGSQDARLIRDFIPGQTDLTPDRRWWTYQCRNGTDKPWISFYVFQDTVEWLPEDFAVVNHYTGHSSESFLTSAVLVVTFLRRRHDVSSNEERVYGKRMLVNGAVKENLGGRTQVIKECKSEEERVEALREWFGVELTRDEKDAIKGYKTALS